MMQRLWFMFLMVVAAGSIGCRHSDRALFPAAAVRDLPPDPFGQERFEIVTEMSLFGTPLSAGTIVQLRAGKIEEIRLGAPLQLAGLAIPSGSTLGIHFGGLIVRIKDHDPKKHPMIGELEISSITLGAAVAIAGITFEAGDWVEITRDGWPVQAILASSRMLGGRAYGEGDYLEFEGIRVVGSMTREELEVGHAVWERRRNCINECREHGGFSCDAWCRSLE